VWCVCFFSVLCLFFGVIFEKVGGGGGGGGVIVVFLCFFFKKPPHLERCKRNVHAFEQRQRP